MFVCEYICNIRLWLHEMHLHTYLQIQFNAFLCVNESTQIK